MRSYMPNPEGEGEKAPTGRISVLEDTDGDGRADKSTVFLDDLVLPRAISCVRGGVLVAEPPNLMFCRDTNGDGKCDEKTIIARDYGITGNPEHQPNGLMPALDNWIYSANYDRRLRWMNGAWVFDHVLDCGQWGMTQDNFGHLFHNNNTNQLRGSIVAPHYVERNPNFRASGANEQIAKDQTVWPLHDTAVDRGYLHTIMRDDGTLRKFTAACAPLIYRGGALGPEYENNAFVCEPAANLIKRDIVQQEPDGTLSARNATEGVEFLASTYERFRPVNLYTGPDGAIYILDMHHGLLQHRVYLTTYCKDQYIERQLDKYMETGRIYRIVPKDRKLFPKPNLSKATTPELIATLDHPNGWWRDTAQRLLVERQDYHALSLLRKMATTDANPIARLHALWTIDSYGMSNPADVQPALNDPEPHIRAAALRMAERLLYSPRRNEILPDVMRLANDRDPSVRLQFALTIPPLGLPETDAAVVKLLSENAQQPYLADAVISGLGGRELEFLRQLLASNLWNDKTPVHEAVLGALARCAFADGSPKRVRELLDLIAQQPAKDSWRQVAMLEPLVPPSNAKRQVHPIMLDAEPTTFV
jgi:hypothetical protein